MTAPVGTDVTGVASPYPRTEVCTTDTSVLPGVSATCISIGRINSTCRHPTSKGLQAHRDVSTRPRLVQRNHSIMEQKRIQNFTLHIFKRDWDVALICSSKLACRTLYQPGHLHINAGAGAVVAAPAPTPPPLPPEPAPPLEARAHQHGRKRLARQKEPNYSGRGARFLFARVHFHAF